MNKWLDALVRNLNSNQSIMHFRTHTHEPLATIAGKLGVGYSTLDKWIRVVNPQANENFRLNNKKFLR